MPTLYALKQTQEALRQRFTGALCAGCGCELRPDYWQPPETSLCGPCEDKISHRALSWMDAATKEPDPTK